MATTIPYLEITDSVTSVKLMDSAATTPALVAAMNYRLSYGDWAPKIAQRSNNPLGLPYKPVMEEMTIDVRGSTPDAAFSKLQVLNTLLDQAERWFNNEIVAPVFIRYQPKGSAKTTYMSDVIIGRGIGNQSNDPMLTLPGDFNAVGDFYFLQSVRVVFWRKNGIWLCESETQNVGASYVAQPGPVTLTWSDFATVLSPIDITLGAGNDATGASNHTGTSGITAITHDSRYFLVINPLTADLSGTATLQADATKFPTNANLARWTCNPGGAGVYDISSFPLTEVEYIAVYVKARNNSTTIDAYVSAESSILVQQEVKLPLLATVKPVVMFLGIFPTRGRAFQLVTPTAFGGNLTIRMRSAGGSITVDLDSILIVGINRSTNIIATSGLTHPLPSATAGIYFLNRMLAEPQGEVAITNVPNDVLQTYTGSAYNFTGANATVKKTSLVHFQTDTLSWNVTNSAATAKITLDLRATRLKAYLTPE